MRLSSRGCYVTVEWSVSDRNNCGEIPAANGNLAGMCLFLRTYLCHCIYRIPQHYDALSDWVQVLDNFKKISTRELPKSSLSLSFPSGLDVQMHLLRRFVHIAVTGKWTKIISNFISAAVHLAFLNSPGHKGEFTELPDRAIGLLEL